MCIRDRIYTIHINKIKQWIRNDLSGAYPRHFQGCGLLSIDRGTYVLYTRAFSSFYAQDLSSKMIGSALWAVLICWVLAVNVALGRPLEDLNATPIPMCPDGNTMVVSHNQLML